MSVVALVGLGGHDQSASAEIQRNKRYFLQGNFVTDSNHTCNYWREKRGSPALLVKLIPSCGEYPLAQQVELRAAIAAALDKLQTVDLVG